MHGEFLVLDKGKMSKSSGDFLTLSRIIEDGYSPLDYRYFCIQSRYRKQLMFSYESLSEAKNSLRKLKNKIKNIIESQNNSDNLDIDKIKTYQNKFKYEISDDLNLPNSLTVLWEVIKSDDLNSSEKIYLIKDFDKVLSLDLMVKENNINNDVDIEFIENLIKERNKARKEKNWAKADEIRDTLLSYNIELIDNREGTTWKYK